MPKQNYSPAIAELLAAAPLSPLGPGKPDAARRGALAKLTPADVVGSATIGDPVMAEACLAGLWLRFNFLAESHRISQEIDTPSGSFWHGILHRRESDFDNSKYWFRQAGRHPILGDLAAAAGELAARGEFGRSAESLNTAGSWDPLRFVDLCAEAGAAETSLAELCREIQQVEWELLFDYCWRQAREE